MADANELDLSRAAAACMRERLPGLLAVVRARRRQRHAARAALLLGLVVAAASPWWWPPAASAPNAPAVPPSASAPPWSIVHDDPTVLARHTVVVATKAEWFVTDDELQSLLAADQRDAGLVRLRGRLLVSKTAIDPFPQAEP